MTKQSSRRLFLRNTAIVAAGISLVSKTPLHALTHQKSPFLGYNPYIPESNDLRKLPFMEKSLRVQGNLYDTIGENTVNDATIEVWHLSPNSSKYRHHGKIITNNDGAYSFITDFPNRDYGKMARIYFKITHTSKTYFTELLINDFGAHITGKHWEENYQLGEKLLPLKKGTINSSSITFNITISI
ncbi:hypothetical protein N8768_08550 [Flavobacteriaceae bacterium]|nr:hypothetical protein [Flavobacteriaceae bacterium]